MEVVVLLKPDVIINNEIALLKKEIKEKLWSIEYSQMYQVDDTFVKRFYSQYVKEDFFEENILKNMLEAPIYAMSVKVYPKITFDDILNIKKEIREKYAKDRSRNSIHISDSFEAIVRERLILWWDSE